MVLLFPVFITGTGRRLGPSVNHLDLLDASAHHAIIRVLIWAEKTQVNDGACECRL